MAFTSLANRISSLPLLLCGPILRRVESNEVTVWVALKDKKKVWLEVYEDISASGSTPNLKNILAGARKTTRVGDHLFLVAVTANLLPGEAPMTAGKLYFYNLFFTEENAASVSAADPNLQSNDMSAFEIHYAHEPEDLDPHSTHTHLPSFCLPPEDLNQLRIVHGSCRKAHAEGLDAMPGIDAMILADRFSPDKRPHYLFLTGDQFYADDISRIMLYMLMDAEISLFGSVEDLPTLDKLLKLPDENGQGAFFFAGERKDEGGFTSHEPNHLATAGEYMSYYLFMWSDSVWIGIGDDDFPAFKTVGGSESAYNEELDSLKKFRSGLAKVKRAMANVPTYMIFDDHDVTDDWYMTHDWCNNVLSDELGRRMVMNGLLAYALFQDWGNKPGEYVQQQPAVKSGTKLLELAEKWFGPNSRRTKSGINITQSDEPELQKYLGIPLGDQIGTIFQPEQDYFVINQDPAAINWFFDIQREKYEIRFLDGRTRRGYPDPDGGDGQDHPDIISEMSLVQQIGTDTLPLKELTIIIAPTPVISIPAVELKELPLIARKKGESAFEEDKYEFDIFDHWKNQSRAAENFFAVLSKRNAASVTTPGFKKQSRILIITGDVHFAAVSRMQYEFPEHKSLVTQLVSSSFKKQEFKTRVLHQMGYKFGNLAGMEAGDLFMGILAKSLRDKIADIDNPLIRFLVAVGAMPLFVLLFVGHMTVRILSALLRLAGFLLLQDWYNEKGCDTRHFLGWTDPITKEGIDKLQIPIDTTAEVMKFEEIKLTKPYVVNKEVLKDVFGPNLKFPDWQYRIDFIVADDDVRRPADDPDPIPPLVDAPSPGDRKKALEQYLVLASNHVEYATKFGNGKEIVGVNNVSEIFFQWNETEKLVKQETWWRLQSKSGAMLKLFPLSKFKASMNFDDPDFPIPPLPIQPI